MIHMLDSYLKPKQNRCRPIYILTNSVLSCYSLQYWRLSFHLFGN